MLEIVFGYISESYRPINLKFGARKRNHSLTRHVTKLEAKSITSKSMQIPAGYCLAHMPLYVSGVNYNVNSIYTKYLAQFCSRIFTFWKISIANLRI